MKLERQEYDEIISEGIMKISGVWVPVEVSVEPTSETEKAYNAMVTVYECDEYGRRDTIYSKESWVPKSMAGNPWWICRNVFDFSGYVANRRFDGYE